MIRSIDLPPDDTTLTSGFSKSVRADYSGVVSVKYKSAVADDNTLKTISANPSAGLILIFGANNSAVFADLGSDLKIIGRIAVCYVLYAVAVICSYLRVFNSCKS